MLELQSMPWEVRCQHLEMCSYGILLLEMFTQKRPTNSLFGDSLTLHDYVKMALLEQVARHSGSNTLSRRRNGGDMLKHQQHSKHELF